MKPEYGKEIKDHILTAEDPQRNGQGESQPAKDNLSVGIKDLIGLTSTSKFVKKLKKRNISVGKISKILKYEKDLRTLQIELAKMQRSVRKNGRRLVILFEGRDAAGKGKVIRSFVEHLSPRAARTVALPIPSELEKGQWYFQRFINQLPNPGEIVLFNRSWYNRALVEPVNGFCTPDEYERFMQQVPEFEHMLLEDGIDLIKFWFSISKREQSKRMKSRKKDPLERHKLGPIDSKARKSWDEYTKYKERMFSRSHTKLSPWIIVRANNKRKAQLESIRYALSDIDYKGKKKAGISLVPDPETVQRFHRSVVSLD